MKLTEIKSMRGYSGYSLDKKSRNKLATLFPPKFPEFIGHHVTYKFGVTENEIPGPVHSAFVTGERSNDKIQALTIEINGKSVRPNGKPFHITWSLDRAKGAKPVHSNNLLATGITDNTVRIPIKLTPKFFRSKLDK